MAAAGAVAEALLVEELDALVEAKLDVVLGDFKEPGLEVAAACC